MACDLFKGGSDKCRGRTGKNQVWSGPGEEEGKKLFTAED